MSQASYVKDPGRKAQMLGYMNSLKEQYRHLLEHVTAENIDVDTVKEMALHIDQIDVVLSQFHMSVESNFTKWRGRHIIPETQEGDRIPKSLMLPIVMDAFVDGLLMGLAVSFDPTAGYILSGAASLEMGVLGMVLGARLNNCTGSWLVSRYFCLFLPPVVMFLSGLLGGLVGYAVEGSPIAFTALVSFGIVALLFLVVGELVIEANNKRNGEVEWWISCIFFLGVWLVLIVDHALG